MSIFSYDAFKFNLNSLFNDYVFRVFEFLIDDKSFKDGGNKFLNTVLLLYEDSTYIVCLYIHSKMLYRKGSFVITYEY